MLDHTDSPLSFAGQHTPGDLYDVIDAEQSHAQKCTRVYEIQKACVYVQVDKVRPT